MAFTYELHDGETNRAIDRTPEAFRLNDGLRTLAQDEKRELYALRSGRNSSSWAEFDLDNWDEERLNPSTCNLRYAHLVANGAPTGEPSLAQFSGPFS